MIADPIDLVDLGDTDGSESRSWVAGGQRRLVVDGEVRPEAEIPAALLEALDEAAPCVISASNVDDEWWEITVEDLPGEVAGTAAAEPDTEDDASR